MMIMSTRLYRSPITAPIQWPSLFGEFWVQQNDNACVTFLRVQDLCNEAHFIWLPLFEPVCVSLGLLEAVWLAWGCLKFCKLHIYRLMMWTTLGFFINIIKTGKKSNPKMTDTFDIQMNNTFTTKFAHQCKFISALHAIIPINNSTMQHYLFHV